MSISGRSKLDKTDGLARALYVASMEEEEERRKRNTWCRKRRRCRKVGDLPIHAALATQSISDVNIYT